MGEKLIKKKNQENETGIFDNQIKNLSKTDFDGHTEFSNLSYKERLMWLSQAVQFSNKYSKIRSKK